MCVIAMCLKKKPSAEILRKMWVTNDDGASITWLNKDRQVEYIKGIGKLEELQNHVNSTELPFLLHLRIASVGGVNPLLTHPFEISKESPLEYYGQCRRVLVMNGTELDWSKCLSAAGIRRPLEKDGKEQPMNDTRAIAMILSQHKDHNFLRVASGKYVIIGYNSPKDEICFRYFGDFTEEDGIFYSNQLWKYGKSTSFFTNQHKNYSHGIYGYRGDWRGEHAAEAIAESKKKTQTQKIKTVPRVFT